MIACIYMWEKVVCMYLRELESVTALYMNAQVDTWHPANSTAPRDWEPCNQNISHLPLPLMAICRTPQERSWRNIVGFLITWALNEGQFSSLLPGGQHIDQLMTTDGPEVLASSPSDGSLLTSRQVWSRTYPTFKNWDKSFRPSHPQQVEVLRLEIEPDL